MDSAQSTLGVHCEHCGALLTPGQAECSICHAEMPPGAAAQRAGSIPSWPQAEHSPAPPTRHLQFGLSSLLLFMTLAAVLCGIIGMNPGLGIAVAILAIPALVRTCVTASRRRAGGQSMTSGQKTAIFLLTLAMIVAVIVAASAAFFFTCLATYAAGSTGGGGSGEGVFVVIGLVLGSLAGLAVAIFLTWLFWKVSHSKRRA